MKRERLEIERRERAYRDGLPPIPVEGRTAILIDDGLANRGKHARGGTCFAATSTESDRRSTYSVRDDLQ